jgi:TMEM175 potassium channel family protein
LPDRTGGRAAGRKGGRVEKERPFEDGVDEGTVRQDPTAARLETFSDGVIAIAITLLVLEIEVPHAEPGSSLAAKLADLWPSYAAYVVSFLTIGIMWINHHHMFTQIERANHTFLMLNVVFLMAIAAIPWSTALVAANLRDADGRMVAALVYGGNMFVIAVMYNVVWRYAASGLRLLDPESDPAAVERISRSYSLGPISYLAATLVALITPWISLIAFAAMALFWALPITAQGSIAKRVRRR